MSLFCSKSSNGFPSLSVKPEILIVAFNMLYDLSFLLALWHHLLLPSPSLPQLQPSQPPWCFLIKTFALIFPLHEALFLHRAAWFDFSPFSYLCSNYHFFSKTFSAHLSKNVTRISHPKNHCFIFLLSTSNKSQVLISFSLRMHSKYSIIFHKYLRIL